MIALSQKELGRKWAALLGRGCRSSAKPCQSTIYFRGDNAEALDRLFQRSDIHRLGQMRVHAGLLALFHILREGICGQRLRSTLAACPHWILCGFSYKSSDIIF